MIPMCLGELGVLNLRAPAHGYLYVYVTNEENHMVSFDNFMILHSSGLLMQENHYYPYGMLIEGLSNAGTGLPKNMYRYTDKEVQNDLNQNFLDFGWRQYDPVIARWHVTDPAEQFYNPYLAIGANPVSLIDPDGRKTHSGMSGTSTKPFDMVLLPDIENGLGGWGGGGGMGIGSLASLSPYDMQKLQLASGTAIASEYKNGNMHMSAGTFGHTLNDGAVVLTNANSGTAFSVIDGANTNYGVVNGQVVDLNLTQPITETYDYSYGQVTETFNNYITLQQGGGGGYKLAADFLRYSPVLGMAPNPFYMAEAIYIDGGFSIVGAEFDKGVFFMLTGNDKGVFKSFTEIAGGAATDISLGIEIGRIDISGSSNDVSISDLYGIRDKLWVSVSTGNAGLFIGGSLSWSSSRGQTVTAGSVQIGGFISIFPVIFGGYNHGSIKP
jgi:RHS repeat-associated protein